MYKNVCNVCNVHVSFDSREVGSVDIRQQKYQNKQIYIFPYIYLSI